MYVYKNIKIHSRIKYKKININLKLYVIMSGRNKCWQYYTTQNDRGPLYLDYILLINHNKNHTLKLSNIYTPLQYRILQCNFVQTSTCQCIIKNEIICYKFRLLYCYATVHWTKYFYLNKLNNTK